MARQFEKDELVYRGRVIEVHKVTMRTGSGQLIDRDLVHYNGAVVVLPMLADGNMVLIKNYRFTVDECLYELCAGMMEPGENPAAAARRELAEETGYQAARLESLGSFFSAPGTSDERMHAFLATGLTQGPQNLENYEEISVEILPEQRARRMVLEGQIHDAKTIAALGLYWLGRMSG